MRGPDDVALQLVLQDQRIAPLYPRRHGAADERKGLMAIQAAQLDMLPVQHEALRGETRFAETDARGMLVDDLRSLGEARHHLVQLGMIEIPKIHRAKIRQCPRMRAARSRDLLGRRRQRTVPVAQFHF